MSHEKKEEKKPVPEKPDGPVEPAIDPRQELADMEADFARLQAAIDKKRVEVHAGRRHYFGPPGPALDHDLP